MFAPRETFRVAQRGASPVATDGLPAWTVDMPTPLLLQRQDAHAMSLERYEGARQDFRSPAFIP